MISLNDLEVGNKAIVKCTNMPLSQKRRILDLGIIPNTEIEAVFKSPFGDPTAFEIRGTVIALRSEDMENIFIK